VPVSKQGQNGNPWIPIMALLGSGHQEPVRNLPVPNVRYETPDDEQRRCPKHVEFDLLLLLFL
jgi:hypothetical protein